MKGMQDDTFDIPEWSNLFEVIILTCGALIAGFLALWYLLFMGWGLLQSSPAYSVQSPLYKLIVGYIFQALIFLVPAAGAFACGKSLKSPQARWPLFASISAAIIGASIMLVFVGVGWHYHPDAPKLMGILWSVGAGILAAIPFAIIAIFRIRKNTYKRRGGALAPTGKHND